MSDFDLFFITDGVDFINLRNRYSGIFLQAWQPGIKDPKAGGVWQDSPMADGRVLVDRPFANATEQLSLLVSAGDQDETIYAVQTLRRMLQKAVNYSLNEWQAEPVWIMARARRESNIRYAIIYDYRAPGEANPFSDPFDGDWPLVPFPLFLERGDWLSNAPGEAECLPLSTLLDIGEDVSYSPSEEGDDAYVNAVFIFNIDEIRAGNQLSQSLNAGIRFQNVAIPQGATILSASLRLTIQNLSSGTVCNLKIRGEDTDSAAAFSTFADFTGRTQTTAGVNWSNIGAYGGGTQVSSPNISAVIQEIIDRAGWVSGNDLVLFVNDNGSDIDAYRRFSSYESKDWAIPVLEITFSDGNVITTSGQESTCENAPFVGNRRSGILTHVWFYDDSTPGYSANLLGLTPPYGLLPSTPAANDALYLMSEVSNPLSAPITSAVFDLSTAMSGVTGIWEYNDGSGWQSLQNSNTPDYGSQPFQSEGINSIHARQPSDMVSTATINFITGWVIRFRVTSVSSPVRPVQQNRAPYTVGSNDVLIESGDLGGDLPALLNYILHNRADFTGGLNPVPIAVGRVIMGARKVSRGEDFVSVINLADKYNPSGITLTAGTNTSAANDPQAPTGRVYTFSPAGAESIAGRLTLVFTNDFSQNYKGVFKPFLRVKQVGGSAGDMGARLRIGIYSASNLVYTSDTLYTTTTDEIELFEFREVTLPPNLDVIKTAEAIAGIIISVDALNTNATPPDLNLIDLFLIPVDEFSLDVYDTIRSTESPLANTDTNRQLELDSAYRLKRQSSALLALEQGPVPILNWAINSNGPITLQPTGDQKLHFLFAKANTNNGWDSYPENAVSIQAYIQKRYFSMRGAR